MDKSQPQPRAQWEISLIPIGFAELGLVRLTQGTTVSQSRAIEHVGEKYGVSYSKKIETKDRSHEGWHYGVTEDGSMLLVSNN